MIPTLGVLAIYGEAGTLPLLVASQVVLGLQLPFAIVPLMRVTNSTSWMGDFASKRVLKTAAVSCALIVLTLNLGLVTKALLDLRVDAPWLAAIAALSLVAALAFLIRIATVRLEPPALPT